MYGTLCRYVWHLVLLCMAPCIVVYGTLCRYIWRLILLYLWHLISFYTGSDTVTYGVCTAPNIAVYETHDYVWHLMLLYMTPGNVMLSGDIVIYDTEHRYKWHTLYGTWYRYVWHLISLYLVCAIWHLMSIRMTPNIAIFGMRYMAPSIVMHWAQGRCRRSLLSVRAACVVSRDGNTCSEHLWPHFAATVVNPGFARCHLCHYCGLGFCLCACLPACLFCFIFIYIFIFI